MGFLFSKVLWFLGKSTIFDPIVFKAEMSLYSLKWPSIIFIKIFMETPAGKQKYDGLRFLADHIYLKNSLWIPITTFYFYTVHRFSLPISFLHMYIIFLMNVEMFKLDLHFLNTNRFLLTQFKIPQESVRNILTTKFLSLYIRRNFRLLVVLFLLMLFLYLPTYRI